MLCACSGICYLCPARLNKTFPRYLIKVTIFEKKNWVKCLLWFSLQRLSAVCLILRIIERSVIKNVHWSSYKVSGYSCVTFIKLEISPNIFEKYSITKIDENLSIGSWVAVCGQKDRQTGMTKLVVALRNFARVLKI